MAPSQRLWSVLALALLALVAVQGVSAMSGRASVLSQASVEPKTFRYVHALPESKYVHREAKGNQYRHKREFAPDVEAAPAAAANKGAIQAVGNANANGANVNGNTKNGLAAVNGGVNGGANGAAANGLNAQASANANGGTTLKAAMRAIGAAEATSAAVKAAANAVIAKPKPVRVSNGMLENQPAYGSAKWIDGVPPERQLVLPAKHKDGRVRGLQRALSQQDSNLANVYVHAYGEELPVAAYQRKLDRIQKQKTVDSKRVGKLTLSIQQCLEEATEQLRTECVEKLNLKGLKDFKL